jgi:hypothetical protein
VRRWLPAIAALLFAAVAVPAAAVPVASDDEVFSFRDDRILESSGLVDLGGTMVTVNDSGDSARVFVVDSRSGRTVGMTEWDAEADDDEALAPAGGGRVWVGDIGDNPESRKGIVVYRVPVARRQIDVRDPETYPLRYPDGAHNAEALVEGPDGSLWIITKSFTQGLVFRTDGPPKAGRTTTLRRVTQVDDYVTDAAMLPDGRHVVVRSLAQASVYTFPGFEVVGRFPLPAQRQGEGVSVGPGGRIRLSSEGMHSPVLQIDLPVDLSGATPTPSAVPPVEEPAGGGPLDNGAFDEGHDSTWLGWSVAAILGVVAVGVTLGLRRRR